MNYSSFQVNERVQSAEDDRRGTIVALGEDQDLIQVRWDRSQGQQEVVKVDSLVKRSSVVEELLLKYGSEEKEGDKERSKTSQVVKLIVGPRRTLNNLRLMSLADSPASRLGSLEDLSIYLTMLSEVDLSNTLLSNWGDVLGILKAAPLLTQLNLSRNRFSSSSILPSSSTTPSSTPSSPPSSTPPSSSSSSTWLLPNPGESFPNLRVLALNDTKVEWAEVNWLASCLPNLQELYLSENNLSTIEFNSAHVASLSTLQLNNNLLHSWDEVWKLAWLPQLENLFLGGNPFKTLSYLLPPGLEKCHEELLQSFSRSNSPQFGEEELLLPFPFLRRIFLNNSEISGWESIEALSLFPRLQEVKIQDSKGFKEIPEQLRRQLMLARLGRVRVLNGSEVTERERESAERGFLRHHKYDQGKPKDYERLVKIHGEMADLAVVDLSAPETVVMVVFCRDPAAEKTEMRIRTRMRITINQLKEDLAKKVFGGKVPSKELRLSFVAKATEGSRAPEKMVHGKEELFMYRPEDGDEIHVERKILTARK